MNKEDKKLQKHLVEEMMKVSKTNPDVMYYMESLMEYCLKIEKENKKQKEVLDKIKDLLKEYKYTNIEDYPRIMEFYRKLEKLLEEIE